MWRNVFKVSEKMGGILFNKRVNTVGFDWFDQKVQKLFYISVRKRMLFFWKK